MSVLLSKQEKIQVRAALGVKGEHCRSYVGAILDAKEWAKLFCHSIVRDEAAIEEVLKDIQLWMELFPKSSNIPNPEAYAAYLYRFLCEDSHLTNLGVKMILEKTLQSKKQIPSISEIAAELKPIKEQHQECETAHKEFMRLYHNAERNFIKRLDDSGISNSLSDILDIRQLIKSWHILFQYDPFPGCDILTHPFKPDETADLVINALSKPRHKNPLLVVFLVIVEVAQKDKITQYNMGDIYREMARIYPDVPSVVGEPSVFYLPSQWKHLNLDKIKPDYGHDTELFDCEELIMILVDPAISQTEIVDYISKATYDYFSLEEMFQ